MKFGRIIEKRKKLILKVPFKCDFYSIELLDQTFSLCLLPQKVFLKKSK